LSFKYNRKIDSSVHNEKETLINVFDEEEKCWHACESH